MAIIAVGDIFSRIFSGYEDPRYPSGYWLGEAAVVGDGSGGDMTNQIDFAKSTGQTNSQFYSLEELAVFQSTATVDVIDMLIANFDLGPTLTGFRYTLPLVVNQGTGAGLVPSEANGLLGKFLGRQSNPNTALSLSFILDNVSGTTFSVRVGGYIWDARSTAVPGGPQKPPTGLYRS